MVDVLDHVLHGDLLGLAVVTNVTNVMSYLSLLYLTN